MNNLIYYLQNKLVLKAQHQFNSNLIVTQMSSRLQQIDSNSDYDSPSQSLQLKFAFCERTNNRLKDENAKLSQKISKLSEDISLLQKQKTTMQKQTFALLKQIQQGKIQRQGLIRRLQLRQQRHESQKNQFLLKQQQQQLLRFSKQNEVQLEQTKNQVSNLMKKSHGLLSQLQQVKKQKIVQKTALEHQLQALQISLKDKVQKTAQLQKLYVQKIEILQKQNYDLKGHSQSLTLQLRLFQRHKQIESLLSYQNNIGYPKARRANNDNKNLTVRTGISKQSIQSNNLPELKCCCWDLQDELVQRDQLIQMLKQKNKYLVGELQSSKRRCTNLQGIICSRINDNF